MPEVWLLCLALNVYFEARNEPISGQLAVAEVTIRRAKKFNSSVCKEVFLDKQFSWTADQTRSVKDLKAYRVAELVAKEAMEGKTNFSKGADHYHAKYVNPKWAGRLCKTATIGQHIFYKECEKK